VLTHYIILEIAEPVPKRKRGISAPRKDKKKESLRATCPLAFAEAFAQAGQGLARLLESYGEQAGGSVAIPLAKSQIVNNDK